MRLKALLASQSLAYAHESGNGYARLPRSVMAHLSLGNGNVIRIRLPDKMDCLCVIYGDTMNALSEDMLCYDDSITIPSSSFSSSSSAGGSKHEKVIGRGECEIVTVYSTFDLSSVTLSLEQINNSTNNRSHANSISSSLVDLPLLPSTVISANQKLGRSSDMFVLDMYPQPSTQVTSSTKYSSPSGKTERTTNPSKECKQSIQLELQTIGIVTHYTRVLFGRHSNRNRTKGDKHRHHTHDVSKHKPRSKDVLQASFSSNTSIVTLLLHYIVLPFRHGIPVPATTHGLLLYGPPGVGKTYAVTALRDLCQREKGLGVTVKVVNIAIPSLLSESEPLAYLKRLLEDDGDDNDDDDGDGDGDGEEEEDGDGEEDQDRSSNKTTSPGKGTANTPPTVSPSERRKGAFSFLSPSSTSPSIATKTEDEKHVAMYTPPNAVKTTALDKMNQGQRSTIQKKKVLYLYILDEIDALGTCDADSEVQRNIKLLLCYWMDRQQGCTVDGDDDLAWSHHNKNSMKDKGMSHQRSEIRRVFIGTSNQIAGVDRRLRRGGRLEKELYVNVSKKDREVILEALLGGMAKLFYQDQHDYTSIAVIVRKLAIEFSARTGGYVSADLSALVSQVCQDMIKIRKQAGIKEYSPHDDLKELESHLSKALSHAMTMIRPSALRGISITLPQLSYEDVIGYENVKLAIHRIMNFASIEMQAKAALYHIQAPGGALLYGPPGNSKTRLVMSAAAVHNLPLININIADIYGPYVGEAESELRNAFRIARQSSPCVLFIDEIDALVTNRGSGDSGSGTSVESRVLATLLVEMDGVDHNGHGVIVMAATNRLDCIDAALLRKGRFHHILEVSNPGLEVQHRLVEYFMAKCNIHKEGDEHAQMVIEEVKAKCHEGMSGAEVEGLCKEAMLDLMRQQCKASEEM